MKIIREYTSCGLSDFFSLYKYLTSIYWKEDVDLVIYDELGYECTKALTNKRSKQNKFRQELLDRYNNGCAISNHGELMCEACHIKPFILCADKEKYDVNNGLLLDAGLHKLFDSFMISINPKTLMLEISQKLDKQMYNFVWEYEGKILEINEGSIKYLAFHYELFENIKHDKL